MKNKYDSFLIFAMGWLVGSLLGATTGLSAPIWACFIVIGVVIFVLLEKKRNYDALRRQYPGAKDQE